MREEGERGVGGGGCLYHIVISVIIYWNVNIVTQLNCYPSPDDEM